MDDKKRNLNENENANENSHIKVSGCVSNTFIIKYFVQIAFSLIVIFFSIYMIGSSSQPSNETLWVSLLTSTASIFINPPKLEK